MLISHRVYTETIETSAIRARNQVKQWAICGIPILTRKSEVWRKAAAVDDELRERVLAEDRYTCVYCGEQDRSLLTMDHRVPQVEGGITHFRNLLTACKSCNSMKCGRMPEEAGMPLVYGRFSYPRRSTHPTLRLNLAPPVPCVDHYGRLTALMVWCLIGLCGLLFVAVSAAPMFWSNSLDVLIMGFVGAIIGIWLVDMSLKFGRLHVPVW